MQIIATLLRTAHIMNSLSRREEETLLKVIKTAALRKCDGLVKGWFCGIIIILTDSVLQLLRNAQLVGLSVLPGHVETSCLESKSVWLSCKYSSRSSTSGLPLISFPALHPSPRSVSGGNICVCEVLAHLRV